MPSIRGLLIAGVICCFCVTVGGADPVKPKVKTTTWIPLWENASATARKDKLPILAYFSGSDWEPFTQKLEKEVLNTPMFRDWAATHVVLFQADFVREKKQSANIKSQNDRLKTKYGIVKIPTFILMDYSGVPFDRAGYDQAKLTDDEAKEEPKTWVAYLEGKIKNKPPDEDIVKQKNLTESIAYGKKHFVSTVLLINHDRQPRTLQAMDDLVHNQEFVKFMNTNVAFVQMEWPYDSDTSQEANVFRVFASDQQLSTTSPLQLAVYDMQTKKVNFRLTAIDPLRADNIVSMVESHLPKLDYNGGWINDLHEAKVIAQQQKRYIFICFTSMDTGDYSKKIFDEIFNTDDFKTYARKHLVTLQIDTPTTSTTQPASLVAQNKMQNEMYNIRGYPSIVILNPLGQKIGDSKYMKGGPDDFIKQMDGQLTADEERRAFLAGER